MMAAKRITGFARHALTALAMAALGWSTTAAAIPVTLSHGDVLEPTRAKGNPGVFSTDYVFSLASPSSATYGVSRWCLAGQGIAGFTAALFLQGEITPLATGIDLVTPSRVISNRFFDGELDPGLYHLIISGDDAGNGYTGSLFISPPLFALMALQPSAQVPEPASGLLFLSALALLMRRRATRPPNA